MNLTLSWKKVRNEKRKKSEEFTPLAQYYLISSHCLVFCELKSPICFRFFLNFATCFYFFRNANWKCIIFECVTIWCIVCLNRFPVSMLTANFRCLIQIWWTFFFNIALFWTLFWLQLLIYFFLCPYYDHELNQIIVIWKMIFCVIYHYWQFGYHPFHISWIRRCLLRYLGQDMFPYSSPLIC